MPPTTDRGIVYPDSGGSTRLWEHFSELATTTDRAIGEAVAEAASRPSLPQTPVGTAGIVGHTSYVTAARYGPVLLLAGHVQIAGSLPGGGDMPVAVLPDGYRPSADVYVMTTAGRATGVYAVPDPYEVRLLIKADGTVLARPTAAGIDGPNICVRVGALALWAA